ncbi:MAG TPA: DUF3854 domain-containing protein, partial [Chitinophagales bacterium]|nr:DUF3854 domain-containing protein [Chitinophagales bacterium]
MNYLQQRLKEIGITDKQNKIKAINLDKKTQEYHFFASDENDNIKINYITPSGYIEYYESGKKTFPYYRLRYKNPENPKNKYQQTKGTDTIPFSTPGIINSYKKEEKIKTLYITEGEFKAFSLDNQGLKTIGIGGIHNYKTKGKSQLHPYIIDYIQKCNVENIVLLFDADCLKVEWAENKDLTTRLKSFYSALSTFNEYIKPFDICLYFAHIKTDSEHKGIDDLLHAIKDKETVLNELQSLTVNNESRKYINTYKISGVSPYLILKIFGLD